MELPEILYAKSGKDSIIYSTVPIKGAAEYIRADKILIELRKLAEALDDSSEEVLNEMKNILNI